MEQAQNLLKREPVVLKDPCPQGQNATSSDLKSVGGTQSTHPANQYYINMVHSQNLLQPWANNYESES